MTNNEGSALFFVYNTNPFVEGQGGGVRYVRELAAAIEKKGGRVVFLGSGGKTETRGNIHYIPITQNATNVFLFLLMCVWARWRYIGYQDAVVHVHRLYFALPFLGRSIKCVATLHGRTFTVFPERFGRILSRIVFPFFKIIERWLLSRVDQVVVVSRDVQDQFQERHPKHSFSSTIKTIPIMVDLCKFRPKESSYFSRKVESHFICLFVGRLATVKNLPLLLKAWEIVATRNSEARLAIAGDGELREVLLTWISAMNNKSSVILLGEVSPDKISDVMSAAKAVVITSHHESGPMVAIEALACGIPVVSTPVGDIVNMVDQGNTGRIVEPDPEVIAAAILDVMGWRTAKEEIVFKARNALDRYSPEKVADGYLDIYKQFGCKVGSDENTVEVSNNY